MPPRRTQNQPQLRPARPVVEQVPTPSVTATVPPHNTDIERALLGAVCAKPERMDDVSPLVTAEDFYAPAHRILYTHILRMVDTHDTVDIVALASALHSAGDLEAAGGSTYLSQMLQSAPLTANTAAYAEAVRDLARRRRTMLLASDLFAAAADVTADLTGLAGQSSDLVDGILADKLDTGKQHPTVIIRDYLEWLDTAVDDTSGIDLPFPKLQSMTGGLMPGEMVVLAARPSNGKTALALNVSLAAIAQGRRVGIVSLEMRSRALMSRMCAMAIHPPIGAQKFRNRTLTREDHASIKQFCGRLAERSFRMWDEPEFTPSRMRATAKQWRRQMGGLDLLVIDYLQLMGADAEGTRMSMNREQEVARISRAIKKLALGEEVPVLLLAQLNREAEKSQKVMLSHLRESGSLEQDADFVWFISGWDPRTPGDVVDVDLIVAKGRSSQTGTVPLQYWRQCLQFQPRPEVGGGW